MADAYLIEILLKARDEASAKIDALQRKVDELRASAAGQNATSDLERGFDDLGESAGLSADEIARHNLEQEKMRRNAGQNRSVIDDHARAHDRAAGAAARHTSATSDLVDVSQDAVNEMRRGETAFRDQAAAIDDTGEEVDKFTQRLRDADQAQGAIYQRFNEGHSSLQRLADGLRRVQQEYASLARTSPIGSTVAEDLAARSRSVGKDATQIGAHATGQDLLSSYEDFKNAVRSGQVSTAEARRGFQGFQSDLGKVSRSFEDGSEAARMFGRAADDAGKQLKNIPLAQAGNDFERFVTRLSQAGDSIKLRVSGIASTIRGLRDIGIIGLFQQLDTAVVGLVGSLFSLATVTVQAGAALGGALVSGLAQAAPAVVVLAAGLERLKNVLDAVKLAQQIKQEAQFDPTQQAALQLQTSESLISAQQGLVDAYNNVITAQIAVKESQEQLTQARIEAIRNITDLTIAEKTASEQALGARLSVIQAEQQLQALEQGGGSQLQLQQAQLAVQEAKTQQQTANIAVPRSRQDLALARRYGVNSSVGVLSAEQSLRQAVLALQRSPVALQEAQAQLKLAQMTAASPSGRETSTQGQLNYLLTQMSGPEKSLYDSLNKLESELRKPGSPISKVADAFIAPFAKVGTQLTSIFENPKLMAPLEKFASVMGAGLSKLFDVKSHVPFFEEMTKDATQNAPIITKFLLGIESLIGSIARAAAPALHQFLLFLEGWSTGLAKTESSASGMKRLTAEFSTWENHLENLLHMLHALHELLKALGEDAGGVGNKGVENFTGSLNSATDWVKTHGPEVQKFFSDSMKALSEIGGILVGIGKLMLAVFNVENLHTLGNFLNQVLLPAISLVAKALGWLVTGFMNFIDSIGPAKDILIVVTSLFVGMLVLNKVADAFMGATKGVQALYAALKVLVGEKSIPAAFQAFSNSWNKIGTSAGKASQDVQQANQDINQSLTQQQTVVADKTAVMDTDLEGVGVSAETGAAGVATAGTKVEATVATEAVDVTAADTTIETENEAAGASFTALLGPIGLAIAAIYGFVQGSKALARTAQTTPSEIAGLGIPISTGETLTQIDKAIRGQGLSARMLPGYLSLAKSIVNKQGIYTGPSYNAQGQIDQAYGVTGSTYAGQLLSTAPKGSQASPSGLMSYLIANGFSRNAAAGIAGNIGGAEDENWNGATVQGGGFAPSPVAGKGYGLAQWTTYSRQAGLEALAQKMGLPVSDARVQYAFILQEINANPSLKAQLNSAVSPASAAQIAALQYEAPQPSTANYAGRQAAATAYANGSFGSNVGVGAAGGPGGTSAQPSSATPSGQKAYYIVGVGFTTATPAQYAAIVTEWKKDNPGKEYPTGPGQSSSGSSGGVGSTIRSSAGGISGAIPSGGSVPRAPILHVPSLPSFLGVNPANTITTVFNFFQSVKNGLAKLNGAFEGKRSISQQITDFTTYASNAFSTFQNVLQANVAQLQTRTQDAAIFAQFRTLSSRNVSFQQLESRPTGIGDVVSRGVGAGDAAAVTGAEETQRLLAVNSLS